MGLGITSELREQQWFQGSLQTLGSMGWSMYKGLGR